MERLSGIGLVVKYLEFSTSPAPVSEPSGLRLAFVTFA